VFCLFFLKALSLSKILYSKFTNEDYFLLSLSLSTDQFSSSAIIMVSRFLLKAPNFETKSS